MKLLTKILDKNKHYHVGLSGGMDSISLTHYLFVNGYNIKAVHVDHSISDKSNEWSKFCELFCKKLGVEFYSEKVNISDSNSNNLEDAARTARYKVFSSFGNIIVAHHVLDQQETFFLKLIRGAGPDGLRCMDFVSNMGELTIYRPMLKCSKLDIEDYYIKNNLDWIEDPSNLNINFDRNFLRNEILPKLNNRFPSFFKSLSHSIDAQKESVELCSDLAQIDLHHVANDTCDVFDIIKLKSLSDSRIKNVLKFLSKSRGNYSISRGQLEDFIRVIRKLTPDKHASLFVNGLTFKQDKNNLMLKE